MAKKTAPQSWYDKVEGKKRDVKFLNYDLDKEVKARFKQWAHENIDGAFEMIDKLIDSGYSVSVKYDTRGACYSAFITCQNEKSPNTGWILAGRGSSSFAALMGALYRHLIVFEEVWPLEEKGRVDLDDE